MFHPNQFVFISNQFFFTRRAVGVRRKRALLSTKMLFLADSTSAFTEL